MCGRVRQHARRGDVGYAAGTGQIGDRDALLVVSEHEGDRKVTLRVRQIKGGKKA